MTAPPASAGHVSELSSDSPFQDLTPRAGLLARLHSCVLTTLLLAITALGAAPSVAPAAELVSNFDKETGENLQVREESPRARGFMTGGAGAGYHLDSIDIRVTIFRTEGLTAQLFKGRPSYGKTPFATLNLPSSQSAAGRPRTVTFGAPAGTVLEPNTAYYLQLSCASAGTCARWRNAMDGTDVGAASGWSIPTHNDNAALQLTLRVHGSTRTPPHSDVALVGNFSKQKTGTSDYQAILGTQFSGGSVAVPGQSQSQQFRTGSWTDGYTLKYIEIQTHGVFGVKNNIAATIASSTLTAASVVGVVNPMSGTGPQVLRFGLSANLLPDTTYTVTLRGIDDVTVFWTEASSGTDAGTEIGWSVEGANPLTIRVVGSHKNVDPPPAGITITPTELTVAEAGGTGTFEVVLDTQPSADVTVQLKSLDESVVTINDLDTATLKQLTFTPQNWDMAQTVTVTGVNDNTDNPGDKRTTTIEMNALSTDNDYFISAGRDVVTVTVTDDDAQTVVVSSPTALVSNLNLDHADNRGQTLSPSSQHVSGTQQFRTGGWTDGYVVESIEINANNFFPTTYGARLYSGSSATPARLIATLNNPTSNTVHGQVARTLTFTAPPNTVLAARTTHTLQVWASSGSLRWQWADDGMDMGADPGWSISGGSADPNNQNTLRVNGYYVTDDDGDDPSGPGPTLPPGINSPPAFSAEAQDQTAVTGEAFRYTVLATDPDPGDTLRYSATADGGALPAWLTLNALTGAFSGTPAAADAGELTIEVTVTDNGGLFDTTSFVLTVEDARTALLRATVKRTLAGVARRALSSALDQIGSRFSASVPMPGLTLAGQALNKETLSARTGALEELEALETLKRFSTQANEGRIGQDDGFDTSPGSSLDLGSLLYASGFSTALNAVPGAHPAAPLWSVWGRADFGTFEGRADSNSRYEGDLRSAWLGVDARSGPWVAGLAVSHATGDADYRFDAGAGNEEGRLETTLTTLYPYMRWTLDNGLELRGVLGAGSGKARHQLDTNDVRETSTLRMRMASLGLRSELASIAGIDLAGRADASVARMKTGDGPDYIDNLSADSWRARFGLEASQRLELNDTASLEPFLEAAVRRDGGDGITGTGVEVAGGVRYVATHVHLEARGRWLAAHSESGVRERGVSLTARLGPGAHGRGLWLTLEPRWGAQADSAQALWGEAMPTVGGGPAGSTVDASLGYGLALASGLLSPFAETSLSGDADRRLRLGTRFAAQHLPLSAELFAERQEQDNSTTGPEHLLRFNLKVGF